jgi:4-alpha-glucanotransferase
VAVKSVLGELPIVAENLGVITDEVENLRAQCGFPGMRVLQFAFGGDAENDHLPHNYTRDTVAYTGTHDNDTSLGWFANLNNDERQFCLNYLKSDGAEINWDLMRAALSSVADIAIIPMQDLLGLGSEARMNTPASESGNWSWRMRAGVFTPDLAERLRAMTNLFGRIDVTVPRTK